MHRVGFGLKLTMLLASVALLGLTAGVVRADLPAIPTYRPAKPVMHFVSQNLGIDDKLYCEFTEPECRYCHGSSTASRHHHTDYAKLGNCTLADGCHEVIPGPDVEPIRDCKTCHIDDFNAYLLANDVRWGEPFTDTNSNLVWDIGESFSDVGAGPNNRGAGDSVYTKGSFLDWWQMGTTGGLGYPHHNSDEADSGQCNACHDYVVETYTGDIVAYDPSEVTPFPASCENCHWWDDPIPGQNPCNPDGPIHAPGAVATWGANGLSIHPYYDTSNPCDRQFAMDPIPDEGTHHELNGPPLVFGEPVGPVAGKCWFCHWSQPDEMWNTDPYNPYAIRYCQNCHTEDTLHSIAEHVQSGSTTYPSNPQPYTGPEYWNDLNRNGLYDVGEPYRDENSNATWDKGPQGNNAPPCEDCFGIDVKAAESNDEKCFGCHGDSMPPYTPPSISPPVFDNIADGMTFGSRWQEITLGGSGFGDTHRDVDHVYFIRVSPYAQVDMPVVSWVDSQIEAKIPVSRNHPPGETYNIKVKKGPIPELGITQPQWSTGNAFTLNAHPIIDHMEPYSDLIGNSYWDCNSVYEDKAYGKWFENLEIIGDGFLPNQATGLTATVNEYGMQAYVELYASADTYRVPLILTTIGPNHWNEPGDLGYRNWSKNYVRVVLQDLYDVNTGATIPADQFYIGDWEVKIVRDYFLDTNGNGIYMYPDGSIDPADELVYQEISEPRDVEPFCPAARVKLHVVEYSDPIIKAILPRKAKKGTKVKILGSGFGIVIGDGVIHFRKKKDSLGPLPDEYYNAGTAYPGPYPTPALAKDKEMDKIERSSRIKMWSNTKIKFKVPGWSVIKSPVQKVLVRVDVKPIDSPGLFSNTVVFKLLP